MRVLSAAGRNRIGCVAKGLLAVITIYGTLYGQQPASPVEPELVRGTVECLATVIHREYFDPDVAARASSSLRQGFVEGRYGEAPTLESLANRLMRDLFAVTNDKHLTVAVVQQEKAASPAEHARTLDESRNERGKRENFGVLPRSSPLPAAESHSGWAPPRRTTAVPKGG